jgi:hypothetical protein
MTLSDLASIGSFVSGAGVLVSLVFLYFQLRQVNAQVRLAERNQQAAVQQQRVGLLVDILMRETEPSLLEAVQNAMSGAEDVTAMQVARFQRYHFARFSLSEENFYQHQGGLLSDEAFSRFERTFSGAFRFPGVRVMWKRNRARYGPEFVTFADRLCADAQILAADDDLARWKADIAAEKAAMQPPAPTDQDRGRFA